MAKVEHLQHSKTFVSYFSTRIITKIILDSDASTRIVVPSPYLIMIEIVFWTIIFELELSQNRNRFVFENVKRAHICDEYAQSISECVIKRAIFSIRHSRSMRVIRYLWRWNQNELRLRCAFANWGHKWPRVRTAIHSIRHHYVTTKSVKNATEIVNITRTPHVWD